MCLLPSLNPAQVSYEPAQVGLLEAEGHVIQEPHHPITPEPKARSNLLATWQLRSDT